MCALSLETNDVGSPNVLYWPDIEICGKPISRGTRVVPCSPASEAKSMPWFRLTCPPETSSQPKRNSLTSCAPKERVCPIARFRLFVVSNRPKPGTKRTEAGEEIVAVSKSVIETHAELI